MSSTESTPSIYEHVSMMLDAMNQLAWAKLGLQPDPVSGKIESNLAEAKVAIDLCAHLATVVEPELDADDKRRISNLIRDLRINYVQKTSEGAR